MSLLDKSKKRSKVPRELREVGKNITDLGKSGFSVGKTTVKGIYDISKTGLDTGAAIGKGVYNVGKAGVKTGIAVGKGMASLVSAPVVKRRSIWDFFWKRRKGIITGAADNDPSGIVTYIQTGAVAGYNLMWLVPIALPMLIVTEEMSSRVGMVTRKGLNQNIVESYGKFWGWINAIIIFVCNTFTIGADIAAMADVAGILTGVNKLWYVLAFGLLFGLVLVKQGFAKVSRYLFLITPIFLVYMVSALLFDVPWGEVLRNTFLPLIENDFNFYMIAVAFLGTTITPFLIFWQTTQVVEGGKTVKDLGREQSAVNWGMLFTQVITFFIVITGAAAFAGKSMLLGTAGEVAQSLAPFGKWAMALFSVGILGSGFIAVPVLAATTGYVVSETLNIESGLSKSFKRAKGFYLAIIFSIIVGIAISLSGYNPFMMLVYSQVLNGVLTPVLIVFLLLICNRKKLMAGYHNGFWTNLLGILTALFMTFFAVMMIIQYMKP